MKKSIFYIFFCLFTFSSNYAQVQIPDAYVPLRYANMNDYSDVWTSNKVEIPSSSIDTTGVIDASDTINHYVKIAHQKWESLKSPLQEFAIVLSLPKGKFMLKKTVKLMSGVRLHGVSSSETEIICNVGEGKHCITLSPENEGETKNAIQSMDSNYKINRKSIELDSIEKSRNGLRFFGFQTLNDSSLVTSSWAKGAVQELFTANSWSEGSSVFQFEFYNLVGNTQFILPLIEWENDSLFDYNKMGFLLETHTRINEYNFIYNAGVHCLGIKRLDTTASQTSNILFQNAVACHVRGVRSEGCNFGHITLNRSAGCIIKRNHIFKGNGYGGGGKAYGIVLQQSSTHNTIVDNTLQRLRHSVLLQSGANKNAIFANYSYDPYWEDVSLPADAAGDLVLHGNYPFGNVFEFNVAQQAVIDDSHGKNGPFNIFHRNLLQGYGIFMSAPNGSDSQVFTGNDITNTSFLKGQYLLQDKGHFQYGNRVKGNVRPSGTGTALQKSVCFLYRSTKFHKDYVRRTGGSFISPILVNLDSIPFGEPFSQTNGIPAWKNPMDFPSCVEPSDYYSVGTKASEHLNSVIWFYPNPSKGEINISQIGKLEVYNTLGQLLQVYHVKESEEKLIVKNKGLLILKLIDEKNRVHVGRLYNL